MKCRFITSILIGCAVTWLSSCNQSNQKTASTPPTAANASVAQETGYSIRGQISIQGSSDLEGAMVALSGTPLYTLTQTDGQFELKSVPPGSYQLEVYHSGYESEGPKLVEVGSSDQGLPSSIKLQQKINAQRISKLSFKEFPNGLEGQLEIVAGDMVPYQKKGYVSMRQATKGSTVKFKVDYDPDTTNVVTQIQINGKTVEVNLDQQGNNPIVVKGRDSGTGKNPNFTESEIGVFMVLAHSLQTNQLDKLATLDQSDKKNVMLASLAGVASSFSEFPANTTLEPYQSGGKSNRGWGNTGVLNICSRRGQDHRAFYVWNRSTFVERVGGGAGDPDKKCVGRCGNECDGLPFPRAYFFTQDCFDHDVCQAPNHEGVKAHCVPELFNAVDDQISSAFYKCGGTFGCFLSHSVKAAAKSASQEQATNNLMYSVRYFLSQTPKGQSYIDLYYKHNLKLFSLAFSHPDIALQLGKVVFHNAKDITLVLSNRADKVVLQADRLKEARSLLNQLSTVGDAEMQKDLQGMDQDIFGQLISGRSARAALADLGLLTDAKP